MKPRQLAGLTVVVVLLTACGGKPAAPTRMDAQTAQLLAADVAAVRSAAEQDDRASGEVALTKLTRDVAQAQAQGHLSAEKAQTILAAGGKVSEDLQAMPTPPPAPTASPDPGEPRKNHKHGKGSGGQRKDG